MLTVKEIELLKQVLNQHKISFFEYLCQPTENIINNGITRIRIRINLFQNTCGGILIYARNVT